MRLYHYLAIDDYIEGTIPHYSSPDLDAALGAAESLSILGYAVEATSSDRLFLEIEQSPDQVHWFSGRLSSLASIGPGSEAVVQAADYAPPGDRHAFARIKVYLSGSLRVRVVLWVTGRGESALT